MRRVTQFTATLIAAGLAVVAAVIGVLSLTVWRPADEVVATVTPEEPYVMTRDGVLPLQGGGERVTVTATAADADQDVTLVLGDSTDITGWIGDSGYTEIIGIERGMTALKVLDHPASGEQAQSGADAQSGEQAQSGADAQSGERAQSGADAQSGEQAQSGGVESPAGNDMWVQETTRAGSASLTLRDVTAGRSVLAAVPGSDTAPTVTVAWAVHHSNGVAMASLALAGVFLVAAIPLFITDLRASRRRSRRAAQLADRASADTTSTQNLSLPGLSSQSDRPHAQEDRSADSAEAEPVPPAEAASDHQGARHASERSGGEQDPPERVPTDSGIIDVSAIRAGVAFPSRRALREARDRGEEHLVVDGHEFDTGITPAVRAHRIRGDQQSDGGDGAVGAGAQRARSTQEETPEVEATGTAHQDQVDQRWTSLIPTWRHTASEDSEEGSDHEEHS